MEDDDIDDGGSNACNRLYENIHSWIIDQWRRTTQSDCDPYVVVELRPGMLPFFVFIVLFLLFCYFCYFVILSTV